MNAPNFIILYLQCILNKIYDFIFPEKCAICGKTGNIICSKCYRIIEKKLYIKFIQFSNVKLNSVDFNNAEFSNAKLNSVDFNNAEFSNAKLNSMEFNNAEFNNIKFNNKNLNSLIYFFKYEKIIRKLILKLKFFNEPYISKLFTKIILKNEKICGKLKFYDIIISVPMYKTKRRSRGYNQTELIGIEFEKVLKIEYLKGALVKIKNNEKQSSLSKNDRYKNVHNVFKVVKPYNVKNKKVILIDDIYTTGATLEECARVLKEAGAKEVIGVVIAKD